MARSPSTDPELLAPAGDWAALRAAVANGADAVYFGLDGCNARHRAANFTLDELPRVMDYLRSHNVRGYVAFNILIFSDELADAVARITAMAHAGVDGVIVQDLGLAQLIHHLAPGLPVHGSTQMTLTEPRGIEFVRALGVQRVILARELSLADIAKITAATTMPVEVFIHGALCVAYSGQCLTSESLGGRSANRGQCAQACRLPYELVVDGQPRDLGDVAYLLSPQDLAAHDHIDSLTRLGVHSFKIEGRLKSAHYVAAATQTYRAALDAALRHQPFQLSPQQSADLAQSFSRGFTPGFLDGVDHQHLVHGRFPKSRGLRIGVVAALTDHAVLVQPDHPIAPSPNASLPLKPGDGVVFDEGHPEQWEQGGRVFEVLLQRPPNATQRHARNAPPPLLELRFGDDAVNLAAIAPGSIVWKTDDPAVRRRLEQSFARERVVRRSPLAAHVLARAGQPLALTLADHAGHTVTVASDQPLALAQRHPLTLDLLREQLGRLGDTPFELAAVVLDGDQGPGATQPVMAPKSVLNDLRRRAVEQLLALRAQALRAPVADPLALDTLRRHAAALAAPRADHAASPAMYVLVRSLEQLDAVLAWQPPPSCARPAMVYGDFEDLRRCKDAVLRARAASMPIALATLRILKPGEEGLLRLIADAAPDAALIRNLAALSFFREHAPSLPLLGDYSLNIANELAAALYLDAGLARLTPGYDLNWRQMEAMFARIDPAFFETVVHQHMPMFHMEHCVFAHTLSSGKDHRDCGRPCESHRVELRDRVGVLHPLLADTGCRNTLFNAQAQSAAEYLPRMTQLGLRHFRVELLRESPPHVGPLLDRYARLLAGIDEPRQALRSLRVLNQLGVTRGTLDQE